ncbi:FUSC family protein [Streptomyces flaveolus]|uniref:FUSC family protein n=1 Tax=Streptomyces flaveolus TaxID=67297 RepID=UPI0034475FB6
MVLAVLIVVPEFLPEYAVVRNYAPAVVFVTPPALLMSDLAAPAPAGELVLDRVLGSVVGIVGALGCALLVVHDRAAARVARAGRVRAGRGPCRTGAQEPRRAAARPRPGSAGTGRRGAPRGRRRRCRGTAAWIDPALLATTEQRACRLLARLHRRRP